MLLHKNICILCKTARNFERYIKKELDIYFLFLFSVVFFNSSMLAHFPCAACTDSNAIFPLKPGVAKLRRLKKIFTVGMDFQSSIKNNSSFMLS